MTMFSVALYGQKALSRKANLHSQLNLLWLQLLHNSYMVSVQMYMHIPISSQTWFLVFCMQPHGRILKEMQLVTWRNFNMAALMVQLASQLNIYTIQCTSDAPIRDFANIPITDYQCILTTLGGTNSQSDSKITYNTAKAHMVTL